MIEYDETDWFAKLLFQVQGSVIPRSLCFAVPAACIAVVLVYVEQLFPGYAESSGIQDIGVSQTYTVSTGVIVIMLGFRAKQALGRFWEGTSLLHQMRGEWFDSVSCLVTFTCGAREAKPEAVREFRHTLVRLMSLCHGSALEEIKDNESDHFEVIDIKGLDHDTLTYLEDCKIHHGFNRVEVLLHMIQVLITKNLDEGVLKIAPPILSRVYQTLSRGLVNLLNATKIKNTKFPFPYAQLMASLLLLHTVWTPFIVTAYVKTAWMAALISFLPIFGMFCVNFTSIELEMPFGNDLNDLPLNTFQHDMNRGLMMLLHHKADMLAHTSPLCIFDFEEIERNGFSVAVDGPAAMKVQSSVSSKVSDKSSTSLTMSKSLFRHAIEEMRVNSVTDRGCEKITSLSVAAAPPGPPMPAPPPAAAPPAEQRLQEPPSRVTAAEPASACALPEIEDSLDKMLGVLARNADVHVAALKENTAAVSALAANLPTLLGSSQVQAEASSVGFWGCWSGAAADHEIAAAPAQCAAYEAHHRVQPDFSAVVAAAQAAAELAAAGVEDAPDADSFRGGHGAGLSQPTEVIWEAPLGVAEPAG